jgi:hypothetical protein
VVFVANKFTAGAWVVVLAVPGLMLLSPGSNATAWVGLELDLGNAPAAPLPAPSLVIVSVGSVSKLTARPARGAVAGR